MKKRLFCEMIILALAATCLMAEIKVSATVSPDDPMYAEQLEAERRKAEEQNRKNWEAIYDVRDKIAAIGTVTYTEDSYSRIVAARTAYDDLWNEIKYYISQTEYKVLTDAEKAYAELKRLAEEAVEKEAAERARADREAVDAVVAKIYAIGEVVFTEEVGARIDDARTAYDLLTLDRKALITVEEYGVLTDAESTYELLKRQAEEAAEEQARAEEELKRREAEAEEQAKREEAERLAAEARAEEERRQAEQIVSESVPAEESETMSAEEPEAIPEEEPKTIPEEDTRTAAEQTAEPEEVASSEEEAEEETGLSPVAVTVGVVGATTATAAAGVAVAAKHGVGLFAQSGRTAEAAKHVASSAIKRFSEPTLNLECKSGSGKGLSTLEGSEGVGIRVNNTSSAGRGKITITDEHGSVQTSTTESTSHMPPN